jgi:hypothetical protein
MRNSKTDKAHLLAQLLKDIHPRPKDAQETIDIQALSSQLRLDAH